MQVAAGVGATGAEGAVEAGGAVGHRRVAGHATSADVVEARVAPGASGGVAAGVAVEKSGRTCRTKLGSVGVLLYIVAVLAEGAV